ncbi:hypothetical protein POPTR_006G120650v4 [Populus trichocarpa]|uniref:Uncharacterized protein n=1 Tax=Populus trichocarpa TaxID=3694 RepID=A0ACC0STY9_POPTR|nr:hypothetical protein POPTR_006G120650v4 [Populus trichocarpa]
MFLLIQKWRGNKTGLSNVGFAIPLLAKSYYVSLTLNKSCSEIMILNSRAEEWSHMLHILTRPARLQPVVVMDLVFFFLIISLNGFLFLFFSLDLLL